MMMVDVAALAVSIARSSAPGSSGFGNASVGNEPSGSNCRVTVVTLEKPASAKSRIIVAPPTPCSGVYVIASSLSLGA